MTLPTPAENPAADVVIYDSHCRFCTNQVRKLARWDGKARLAFLSLHDPEVAKLYPQLSYDDLMKQMYVVTPGGTQYAGAAAFRYLTRCLPRLYALAPLLHIPFSLPMWQWLYRQIVYTAATFRPNVEHPPIDELLASEHYAPYAEDWGRAGDRCVIACIDDEPVGGAFSRLFAAPKIGD